MKLIELIDQYDEQMKARIRELEAENQRLREELADCTTQIVNNAGQSSLNMLNASLAGIAMMTKDQDTLDMVSKLSEAVNGSN